MVQCDSNNCLLLQRHHRNRRRNNKIEAMMNYDTNLAFFVNTMDSIHCHICHLYDVGLRLKVKVSEDELESKGDDEHCFDQGFANMCNSIQYKQTIASNDDDEVVHNKFSINANNGNKDNKDDQTYTDGLYQFLGESGVTNTDLTQIQHILEEEEYDSDAWIEDVDDESGSLALNSNMKQMIDDKYYNLMYEYINHSKSMYYFYLYNHYFVDP